jgi:hypothetical protein
VTTNPFLDNAGGFTPVPDELLKRYAPAFEPAYVWGVVWRYCQMENGSCTASHDTIAARAKMSRRTIIKYLDKLIEDGYVEDLTPGLRNKPHTYCTKKGEALITTMQISHTEQATIQQDNDVGMRNLHSDSANNAQQQVSTMQDLHTDNAEFAQPTMQDLHLKKDSQETPLKESSPNGEDGTMPPSPVLDSSPGRIEYTDFQRGFLARFNAKRFKNPTQYQTLCGLTEKHGEPEVSALAEWAANKGMGLGDAIPAIKSALSKPRNKNGVTQNGNNNRSSQSHRQSGNLDSKPVFDPYTGLLEYPDGHTEPANTVP